ncbi:MAG: hypothetical protein KBF88_05795 [Polyangiaceae bacterium]|nr:hypothetical protein [Polyangiaceae bacterium]
MNLDAQDKAPRPAYDWLLYALRDELPIPAQGWRVEVSSTNGFSAVVRFWNVARASRAFDDATRSLFGVLDDLCGKPEEQGSQKEDAPIPCHTTIALVQSATKSVETLPFALLFGALEAVVRALRHSTNGRYPKLTIERVWPIYLRGIVDDQGKYDFLGPVIVEHGLRTTPVATQEQLERALLFLDASSEKNPVELYGDFKRDASNAASVAGNYVDAIVKGAIAAELLIKHVAWLLNWEAGTKLAVDPTPLAMIPDLFGSKPARLISGVLSARLGGNWNSSGTAAPVGAWRHNLAQLRTKILHFGFRPAEGDVGAPLRALDQLEQHIVGCVRKRAAQYPRTALILLGIRTLSKHKQVREILATSDRATLLREYWNWIELKGEDANDDD